MIQMKKNKTQSLQQLPPKVSLIQVSPGNNNQDYIFGDKIK